MKPKLKPSFVTLKTTICTLQKQNTRVMFTEFGDKSNEPMPMECDKFKNCNGWMEELADILPQQ